ncbi:hypothetical protein [Streptomyces sp. t39]|uniref:hypothetical protein n=1 Tax=Streptomyces sp. t39 TaxID=1828156 RepID=UPI0011CD7F23|nr:hypothetical protein [Streptomyces sp. t39]TXS46972.1 hypothetical protein EAO77_32195 [Streptomyces sp. t39]
MTPPLARPAYLQLVRASAWYDLAVTGGFATPWTFMLVHDALSSSGEAFGWGALPELDTWQILYANLMGSVVVVWAALRVIRPLPLHGAFDGAARILFSTWMVYALAHGASRVVWLFLSVEVAWGILQLAPWLRYLQSNARSDDRSGPVERSGAI